MKSSLIIILTLLFFAKSQTTLSKSYSINTFIQSLQNSGILQILRDVKFNFGVNVSTELCKTYVDSPYCEEVCRVYIPEISARRKNPISLDRSQLMEYLVNNNYLEILQRAKPKGN